MLTCNHCQVSKLEVDFTPDRRNKSGRREKCRSCVRKIRAKQRLANRLQGLCHCGAPSLKESRLCFKHKEQSGRYYKKYRQDITVVAKMRSRSVAAHHRLKTEVFQGYGGVCCQCCGDNNIEFLSIDHIEGKKQPGDPGRGGGVLYRWLKKQGFPSGYRVLCMNCNFALGHAGYCPHQKQK